MKINELSISKLNTTGAHYLRNQRFVYMTKALFTIILFLGASGAIRAADRFQITSNDLPFFARFERGLIHTDGQWAAIAFYRPPSCIPGSFNLLDFSDFSAFGCNAPEPYLSGFGIFMDGPFAPPIQSNLQIVRGRVMPVWFVHWSAMQAAIADDQLTIGELEAMPSLLKGGATFYTETLHPVEVAQQTMTSISASGLLENGGGRFAYQATETHNRLRRVKITFN